MNVLVSMMHAEQCRLFSLNKNNYLKLYESEVFQNQLVKTSNGLIKIVN